MASSLGVGQGLGQGSAERGTPVTSRERWLLLAIVVAGAIIRIAFARITDRDDLGFNDQFLYHHMADGLSQGNGYQIFGEATLKWPPAFAFVLSLPYRITGHDPSVALLTTAALSVLVIPATHWCARPFIGARAALIAAAVVAVLPGQWAFAGTVLSEPLSTVLILLVLGLAIRRPPTLSRALVIGLLIGLAALTRGEGPLLGLVVVVAWWPARADARRHAGLLAVAAVTAIAVITPWVIRNSAIAGEPTGLSLNFADTFYSGHNPIADGGATYATRDVLLPAGEQADHPAQELANAELLQDLAIEWAREHPREELELIPKKLWHLLSGDSDIIGIWVEGGQETVLGDAAPKVEALADVTWFILLGAFALTLVVRREVLRERWVKAALVLPACSLLLYGVVLYGNVRYHIPYEPLMVLVVCAGWFRPGEATASSPAVGATEALSSRA